MILTVQLKELKFYAFHGVTTQENNVGNDFIVHVTYTLTAGNAIHSDNLHDTVNYADVYQTVKTAMQHPAKLIECLAGRILNKLQKQFPQLLHIKVTVEKLHPPLGGEVHSASVTLET